MSPQASSQEDQTASPTDRASADTPTSGAHTTLRDQDTERQGRGQRQERQRQAHQGNHGGGLTIRELVDVEQLINRAVQQIQQSSEGIEQTDQLLQRSRQANSLAVQSLATRRGLTVNPVNTTRPPSRTVVQVAGQFSMIQHAIQQLDTVQDRLLTVEFYRDPELTHLGRELDRVEEQVQLLQEQTGMPQDPRSPREENHRFDLPLVRLEGSLSGVDERVRSRQEPTRPPRADAAPSQQPTVETHYPTPGANRRPTREVDAREQELNQLERDLQETDRLLQPLPSTGPSRPRPVDHPTFDPRHPGVGPRSRRVDTLRPTPRTESQPIPRSNTRPDPLRIPPYNPHSNNNPTNRQIAQLTRQVGTLERELQEARATNTRQEKLIDLIFDYAVMEEERHQREQERQHPSDRRWRPGIMEEQTEARVLRGENMAPGARSRPAIVNRVYRPYREVRMGNTNSPTWRDERRRREEEVRQWVERRRREEERRTRAEEIRRRIAEAIEANKRRERSGSG